MPTDTQRIKEIIVQLAKRKPVIPQLNDLKVHVEEMAKVLMHQIAIVQDLAESESGACVEENPGYILDVERTICFMLRKSMQIKDGLAEFRSLQHNYALAELRTISEDTLSGYRQGFDRAIGELAKFLRVNEHMVAQWEKNMADEESEEAVPQTKSKRSPL